MTRAMKENTPFRIAFCVLCHKYTPVLARGLSRMANMSH